MAITAGPDTLVLNWQGRTLNTYDTFFVEEDSLNTAIADNDSLWGTSTELGGALSGGAGAKAAGELARSYTIKIIAKSGQ